MITPRPGMTTSTVLSLQLAVRAMRWRGAASATVFVVALIGITAATVGPIYLRAVDETVLSQRMVTAPQTARDLRIDRQTSPGATHVNWHAAVGRLASEVTDRRYFDPPAYSEQSPIQWRGLTTYATEFAAIDGLCRHVRVAAGKCISARSTRDTVVTLRTAAQQHIRVGQVLDAMSADTSSAISVRVVGIVVPLSPHGAYWRPWNYLSAIGNVFDTRLPQLDAFFVSHSMLDQLQYTVSETISANLRLRAGDVRIDDLPRILFDISRVQQSAAHITSVSSGTAPTVASGLPRILSIIKQEMTLARTLVFLSTAQLVLLAIIILYAVVAGTAVATGHEVALAKLRGRSTRQVLGQGLAQTLILVALAAPCAALLAWLIVKLVAAHLLTGEVSIAFPISAVEVVAAATTASVFAAAVAARRIITSPVGALLRRGNDPSNGLVGLVLVDAATVALALAAIIELVAAGAVSSGKTNPVSAVTAVLLGAAIAIAVVRLLPIVSRVLVQRTRESSRLAIYLALRQITRRPAGARVIVLVGVALALATFALINWSVAASNRDARALNDAGASSVLTVSAGHSVTDLRTAVDRADPNGHSMAAAVVQVDRSTPLLAVDTKRFVGVGSWPSGNSSAGLHAILNNLVLQAPPPIDLTAAAVQFTLDITKLPRHGPVLELAASLTGADHVSVTSEFGTVRLGRHAYRADIGTLCAAPCRLTGLSLADKHATSQPSSDSAEIIGSIAAAEARSTRSTTWQPVRGFGQPSRWRVDQAGLVHLTPIRGGLAFTMQKPLADDPWPGIVSADIPVNLPAVVASGTAGTYLGPAIHDITSFGFDSRSLTLNGLHIAVSLPQLDRTGVMVDYGTVLAADSAGLSPATRFEVFLSPGAPADMAARLAKVGVHVLSNTHASTFRDRLDQSGPAYADGLFLIAAGVAVALAVGATVLAGVTTARRRSYELAALASAGARPRTLRLSVAVEQGILLVAGLVVGLSAGIIGARLALPSTPVFVDPTIGPPIDHRLPIELLALLAGALGVVFIATSVVVARFVVRQANGGRLREAQA